MAGFLRTDGRHIVDEDGDRLLLRGVGLGNWLLPEGYMWRLPAPVDRPRRIERLVERLIGSEHAAEFWSDFRDRFITEDDVHRLAEQGFNSLRVPINARLILSGDDSRLLDELEMTRIDRLIAWCRAAGLYVIVDLHGAPGGQTGTNIDDSEHDEPELFLDAANADLTVDLWRAIAARYADEPAIAGYDLLNEPLPNWFSRYNDRLMPLYTRLTAAIREVDRTHTIILEGAHWATDWSVFTERIDENLVLQFHKYWNNPDRESLAPYLALRDEWDVPIFMGEGGENNTDWYAGAFQLFEDLDISWNFWTWKKMDTTNSPLSIRRPAGWDGVVEAVQGGPDPSPEDAAATFAEYADNVASDRCDRNDEVINAIFRRPPVRVPAIFYSHSDAGHRTGHPASGTPSFRAGDRMPMVFVNRPGTPSLCEVAPSFEHGGGEAWGDNEWIGVSPGPESWLAYDLHPLSSGSCPIELAVRANTASALVLETEDESVNLPLEPGQRTARAVIAVRSGGTRITVRVRHGEVSLISLTLGAVSRGV